MCAGQGTEGQCVCIVVSAVSQLSLARISEAAVCGAGRETLPLALVPAWSNAHPPAHACTRRLARAWNRHVLRAPMCVPCHGPHCFAPTHPPTPTPGVGPQFEVHPRRQAEELRQACQEAGAWWLAPGGAGGRHSRSSWNGTPAITGLPMASSNAQVWTPWPSTVLHASSRAHTSSLCRRCAAAAQGGQLTQRMQLQQALHCRCRAAPCCVRAPPPACTTAAACCCTALAPCALQAWRWWPTPA